MPIYKMKYNKQGVKKKKKINLQRSKIAKKASRKRRGKKLTPAHKRAISRGRKKSKILRRIARR